MLKHPDWLFAESVDGERQFIIHTVSPRFIGEIFDEDDSDLATHAILDEVSIALRNGQTLANIIWLDLHSELTSDMLRQISDALAEYDARLGVD